ncbi:double-stranded RNA binding motif containing protein [Musa troglodytarum]|uniref:Double-stranded RNA binding motif containing protein n=1 Tax=Musa troglodytarum TaxID=320322 RepID=A0A9E7KH85_9LILI|nr:double-stranded RNA binding motif containing protein [Musa troglodytarum]
MPFGCVAVAGGRSEDQPPMDKSRLQQLCQQRQWPLPEYAVSREGPDHDPHFRAMVTVNGAAFHSPDDSRTIKESQNKAAQVALEQLPETAPPPPTPSASLPPALGELAAFLGAACTELLAEKQLSHKSHLQSYLQKNNKGLPTYQSVPDGTPSHRFRASVKFDGETFESSGYFHTDYSGVYKMLLQELAQKGGMSLPKYTTTNYGESHMPTFSSKVEIKGEFFQGDVAKTKKQAENNAAKVALSQLEGYPSRGNRFSSDLVSKWQANIESEPPTSSVEPIVNMNSPKPSSLLIPASQIDAKKTVDIIAVDHGATASISNATPVSDQITNSTDEVMGIDGSHHRLTPSTDEPEITAEKKDTVAPVQDPESADGMKNGETLRGAVAGGGSSALSSDSNFHKFHPTTTSGKLPTGSSTSSLLRNRVQVYPRKPDLVLPEELMVGLIHKRNNPMEEKPAAALRPRRYTDFKPQHRWLSDEICKTLIVELPGFKREQLVFLIDTSRQVKLRGERHIEGDRWSRFDMAVRAPKHCNAKLVTAKFDPDNGLLCVTLPGSASKPPPPTTDCRDRRRRLQLKAYFAVHYTLRKAWERLCKLFCLRLDVKDSFKRDDSVKR